MYQFIQRLDWWLGILLPYCTIITTLFIKTQVSPYTRSSNWVYRLRGGCNSSPRSDVPSLALSTNPYTHALVGLLSVVVALVVVKYSQKARRASLLYNRCREDCYSKHENPNRPSLCENFAGRSTLVWYCAAVVVPCGYQLYNWKLCTGTNYLGGMYLANTPYYTNLCNFGIGMTLGLTLVGGLRLIKSYCNCYVLPCCFRTYKGNQHGIVEDAGILVVDYSSSVIDQPVYTRLESRVATLALLASALVNVVLPVLTQITLTNTGEILCNIVINHTCTKEEDWNAVCPLPVNV
jgi:hypothetical protein